MDRLGCGGLGGKGGEGKELGQKLACERGHGAGWNMAGVAQERRAEGGGLASEAAAHAEGSGE
ncbi:hypothetical protein E2562_016025 [Oryza meyeriana var. granulata]|uniref:Uncharacterized protein n=1 Tax=Oryza meyeriana var. granulata TaxID=110450 RepID=A0A6G1EM33_9ORYZ|nr:hypothetical protein E2562_016025 [Oryza meyeriana var. granulata]